MHTHFATPIPLFACPSDSRPFEKQYARGKIVALTSDLGNAGRRLLEADGTFLTDQAVRFKDITDGLSNTILVVERPASADHSFGWWDAGAANPSSALDSLVGFAERNLLRESHVAEHCMEGPYYFRSSHLKTQCGIFHPWSLHPEGANMVFADGAIRFVAYTADNTLLIAQSTRSGGEFAAAGD